MFLYFENTSFYGSITFVLFSFISSVMSIDYTLIVLEIKSRLRLDFYDCQVFRFVSLPNPQIDL